MFSTISAIRFQTSVPVLNQITGCLISLAARIKAGTAIVGFVPPANSDEWARLITVNDEFVVRQAKQCAAYLAENTTIAALIDAGQSPSDNDVEWVIINSVPLATMISTSGA